MRRAWMALAAAGLVGLGFGAGSVWSQDMGGEGEKKPAGEGAPAGPSPEEMEAWMKYMTPGPEHQKMASQAGEWITAGKFWMGGPAAPPTESKGAAKLSMILGGRYQVQEYKGDFMGMPFDGYGISGYDNGTREHFTVWVDSMSTGMMVCRGKADDKGVLTLRGTMTDPRGMEYEVREVFAPKDADSMHFEMYMKGQEYKDEFKMMELSYSRKK